MALVCLAVYLLGPVVVFPMLKAVHFFPEPGPIDAMQRLWVAKPFHNFFVSPPGPNVIVQGLWVAFFSLPLLLGFAFFIMDRFSHTRPADLGLGTDRWRENVGWGCAGYLLATPMVLGLFGLLSLLPRAKPHPFAQMVQQHLTPLEWGLFLFVAAVYAPLTEELIFRGLLQGWLRRASLEGHAAVVCIAAGFSLTNAVPSDWNHGFADVLAKVNWWRVGFTTILFLAYLEMLRRRFVSQSNDHRLPIFGSAMCFALVHPPWPDPVALLLPRLVLGWLAYRTQSLLPGLVLHALFNALAWLSLLLSRVV